MNQAEDPIFEIKAAPPCVVDKHQPEALEDLIAGQRTAREVSWRRYREAAREKVEVSRKASEKQKKDALEMIKVADEFEGALKAFADDKKLHKQKEANACVVQLFESLCHSLENTGVYRIELKGKSYNQVDFKGNVIQFPWEVVGTDDKKPDGARSCTAKRVVRSLWVFNEGAEFYVLRRGQVYY
jgi:hypothetical protein